jgi:thiamine pyrophosphokinase
MTLADVITLLEISGHRIEVLSRPEFMQRIVLMSKNGNLSRLTGIIEDISSDQAIENITITAESTRRILECSGFEWPVIDQEYIASFLNIINEKGVNGV